MSKYFSVANMTAGFVGTMIGFTSSVVLIFQAASSAGATQAQISSWILALGIGIAINCIVLSLRYRMPILIGWSTPGAALLVSSLPGVSLSEAIGAFIFAALLTLLSGVTGLFEKVLNYIPRGLTSAMLAGILIPFGMNIFDSMQHQLPLVLSMLIMYLIGKQLFPRYVVLVVLISGVFIAKAEGLFHIHDFQLLFSTPVFITPTFSLTHLFSIGLPLFLVTMTSQNVPGTAVLKASGYKPPISPIISWLGFTTLFLAPFGCYAINLAAITAAICTGEEADTNPNNRYKASIFAGLCWILVGLFGATVVALFFAFPKELVLSVAGLALLSTIGNSLKAALEDETQRESAVITILVCASGISIFGIGAAFWGLIMGVLSLFVINGLKGLKTKRARSARAA